MTLESGMAPGSAEGPNEPGSQIADGTAVLGAEDAVLQSIRTRVEVLARTLDLLRVLAARRAA